MVVSIWEEIHQEKKKWFLNIASLCKKTVNIYMLPNHLNISNNKISLFHKLRATVFKNARSPWTNTTGHKMSSNVVYRYTSISVRVGIKIKFYQLLKKKKKTSFLWWFITIQLTNQPASVNWLIFAAINFPYLQFHGWLWRELCISELF